ncbi:Ff.00g021440.m01.CDS01 [Fusarium sp. VM40]|nr:Ff.00g021440.m01.CDS01 [Fusarium sp. VM40]
MATSSSPALADHVLACLHGFKLLYDAPHIWENALQKDASQRGDTEQMSLLKLKDEQSRFMVWVGNIGAHRNGCNSLDHRLQDASNIRDHIIQILLDLIELLGDTKEILEGKPAPSHQHQPSLDMLNDDPDDDSFPLVGLSGASELPQILISIAESINCLFRLSVSINNPFPHDRLTDVSSADTSYFESFDIDHVRKTFSTASDAIIERLGKANSRRRQEGASSSPQGFNLTDFFPSELQESDTEPSISRTSYATSDTIPGQQKVPDLPAGARDGSFECPFCFLMISAPSEALWKKHVFSDLCPYICVELECPAPDQDFQHRHQWIDHMRKHHWRSWACCLGCDNSFTSLEGMVAHLTQVHSVAVTSANFKGLLSICEKPKPTEDSAECPLCKETLESFDQYQRHIAHHQEDLALFTLPQHSLNDDESSDDVEDDEQTEAMQWETGGEDKLEAQDIPLETPSGIILGDQKSLSDDSSTGTYARKVNQHLESEAIKSWIGQPAELPDVWAAQGTETPSDIRARLTLSNLDRLRSEKGTTPSDKRAQRPGTVTSPLTSNLPHPSRERRIKSAIELITVKLSSGS